MSPSRPGVHELRRLRRFRHAARDERGVALISVIGVASVIAALTAVVAVRSINNLGQVRNERVFEQAVHIAESGIDHTFYMLGQDSAYNTGDTLPNLGSSGTTEKDWVLQQASSPSKVPVTAPDGQWVAIKPRNANVVYSVGYVPSRAAPEKTRVLRVEYDFSGIAPDVSILTGNSLSISGNPEIYGSKGSAHSNGNVSVSGDAELDGFLAASGSYSVSGSVDAGDPANTGGGKPPRQTIDVDVASFHYLSEYDLCPDGTVRKGPAFEPPFLSSAPCTGTVLGNATSNSYRGWKLSGTDASQGAKWDYGGDQPYDGVYYVYQGSATVGSNPGTEATPWKATIFAEAEASGPEPHCPHTGGDITISGNPVMRFHDKGQPFNLVAGRDLKVGGNPIAEGLWSAHEQFDISGNPELTGVIVSGDACDSASSAIHQNVISGNPIVTYNGGLELPGSVLRIVQWLEL